MKFTIEMLEKAKTAKTAEELLKIAKAENVELTAEEAARYFADLHKSGELSDEELDNVAGGCGGTRSDPGRKSRREDVVFLYEVGQEVVVSNYPMPGTQRLKIKYRRVGCNCDFIPEYGFERASDGGVFWKEQYDIYVP